LAGEAQVEMVCPDFESQDMRQSVELLVEAIEASDLAASIRGCLMTPADHPVIHPDTLQQLLAGFEADRYAIHLPVHEGRRGHPVLLPWQLARQVRNLPEGTGVNALRALPGVQTIEHQVRHPSILWDLDTPADYQAFLAITGANEE